MTWNYFVSPPLHNANARETNLKRKSTVDLVSPCNNDTLVKELNGYIQCEQPNENLLTFEGRITVLSPANLKDLSGNPAPLSMNNMAPRGSVLRNTEWCYALVVYTGSNTKIIKNLKPGVLKVSTIDHALNKLVVAAFVFNLAVLAISVILEYVNYSSAMTQETLNKSLGQEVYAVQWYIGPMSTNSSLVI
jgi:phospholipid-transporting ATPase